MCSFKNMDIYVKYNLDKLKAALTVCIAKADNDLEVGTANKLKITKFKSNANMGKFKNFATVFRSPQYLSTLYFC